MTRTIRLNDEEQQILGNALDLYIRVGLGQFSEVSRRLALIHGRRMNPEQEARIRDLCEAIEESLWDGQDPWRLEDTETSLYTLLAFLIEGRLCRNAKQTEWAERRCSDRRRVEQVDQRET